MRVFNELVITEDKEAKISIYKRAPREEYKITISKGRPEIDDVVIDIYLSEGQMQELANEIDNLS